jgi:glycosyltransferase involved in cell wall biosynthesis
MDLTVAICTWNRAALLAQTLEQMRQLVIPPGVTWELIVVNNNCTDDTDQVIARFAGVLPVRRVFEPTPGLSHARNAAIARASGELILWTDDDVLVSPQWLAAYVHAAENHPDAAFFGGPIEPWFVDPPPTWIVESLPLIGAYYALRRPPVEGGYITPAYLPYGANYVIRTPIQCAFLYNGDLGHKAGCFVAGEETDVLERVLRAGHRGVWVCEATVKHYIPPQRLTRRYIRQRAFGTGQLLAYQQGPQRCATMFGRPRWLLRQAILAECRYQLRRWFVQPKVAVRDLREAGIKWGMFWGARVITENAAPPR